jgi:hypothetical protein
MLMAFPAQAEDRELVLSVTPNPVSTNQLVTFTCEGTGEWSKGLRYGKIWLTDSSGNQLINRERMALQSGYKATYTYTIPSDAPPGKWNWKCKLKDKDGHDKSSKQSFHVINDENEHSSSGNPIEEHLAIESYEGPQTCIACHEKEAHDMLSSIHMKWAGPTPNLSNTNGEELGKEKAGINTFCTYAPSSKGACYGCHIRADGNAGHEPELGDVDCLMCHNDTYQRTFVMDTENPVTVENIFGELKSYIFGKQDAETGDYTTVPDYNKMPEGTTMVELAQNVHMPTRKSCLRCHATAGGGDWTKRGDMGLSSISPDIYEDVHMSPFNGGADLSCTNCHKTLEHKIGGRGIDLRADEMVAPRCTNCHEQRPHSNPDLDRHAEGQLACQSCHISEFAKGGATEMSRDWLSPTWNPAFCAGQGGFVGHEIKQSNVKPEYRFFDGTSYVYNLGETITPNSDGSYTMAKANGKIFDGKSKIVPIKNHLSVMPLHNETKQIIAPEIMQMFMTGDFDRAVRKGMQNMGIAGDYSMVNVNAEMLISHGVGPKNTSLACNDCHDSSGKTPDGSRQIPFTELGYHIWPEKVKNCTLCHEQKSMNWQEMHKKHTVAGSEKNLSCQSCHTSEPIGLAGNPGAVCSNCHEYKSPNNFDDEDHKKHIEKGSQCSDCHKFE